MKRVWKPLDVGGLRLYKVHQYFNNHPEWHKEFIVAAKKPTHASQIIEEVYKTAEFIEQPYYIGEALNVFMPESWWENGIPQVVAGNLTTHAPDMAYASACKECGKPVTADGHLIVADVDGIETITAAYCPEHWEKLGE